MSDVSSKSGLDRKLSAPRRAVFLTLGSFLAFAGSWAAFAPLSAASIAPGIVSPDSGRKTVQHLEGGIVETILVSEGQAVTAGQPLFVLVDARASAALALNQRRQLELRVQKARLQALQHNLAFDTTAFSKEAAATPDFAAFLSSQALLFEATRRGHEAKMARLDQDLAKSQEALRSAEGQSAALGQELGLVKSERDDVDGLLTKGLTTRPRSLALKRREAQISAQNAALGAQLEAATADAAIARAAKAAEQASFEGEISLEAARVETDLATITGQLSASADVVKRMQVTAPEDGVIVALKVKTPGAVLPPGAPLADLVPNSDAMVLDIRVRPQDITRVHAGQAARVNVTAFPMRETRLLNATVETVSADAVQDQTSRETYYRAELRVKPEDIADLPKGLRLQPGMQVEAYIEHHARSAIDWFAEPLMRSMYRAGRE